MTEDELFTMVKRKYIPDLKRFDDEFSNADCYSDSFKFMIELKCRRTHYDELMIEEYKYERLVNLAMDTDYNPIYICSTPRGAWAFNLNFYIPNWQRQRALPKTTDFENTDKIEKVVGYLNIKEGVRLW